MANWLGRVKIVSLLRMGFGALLLMAALMAAVGVTQLRGMLKLNEQQLQLQQRVQLVNRWRAATELNLNRVMAIAKSGNQAELASFMTARMKQTSEQINELQKTLEQQAGNAEIEDQMARIAKSRQAYLDIRKSVMAKLGQDDAAGMALVDGQLAPAADAYLAAVQALVKLIDAESERFGLQLREAARLAGWTLGLLALAAIAMGLLIAWHVTRSVRKPMVEARKVAQAIASGDLSQEIEVHRSDEIGDLLTQIRSMQQALRRMVTEVRQGTTAINTATQEINLGTLDLSNRTEQTAANLQQTASSMEELSGTVAQTAESARNANALMQGACESANRGGAVVSQVVSTMEDIHGSSRRIGDIIGVIDGIAFQTNILALNAAVEAARAGEQGRGFAVVASEVRALAQRSAEAAREIKSLIGESVSRVEAGTQLVGQAGQTMEQIVGDVQRVAGLVAQIANAAASQSNGLGMVNTAVHSLDEMTQRNAALVEQSSAASGSLKEQAQQLQNLVAAFRV